MKININEIREFFLNYNYDENEFIIKPIPELLADYMISKIQESKIKPVNVVFGYIYELNKLKGIYILEENKWLLNIFNYSIWTLNIYVGKIQNENKSRKNIYQKMLSDIKTVTKDIKIDAIFIKTSISNIEALDILQKDKFKLITADMTFISNSKNNSETTYKLNYKIRLAKINDLEVIKKIIKKNTFKHDQYHMDPLLIDKKCDLLFIKWIEDSFAGYADNVFVAENNNGIAGFISIRKEKILSNIVKKSILKCDLAAVNHRSCGAFISLLDYVAYNYKRKYDYIVGTTNIGNLSAINVASKLYRFAGAQYCLHKWFI